LLVYLFRRVRRNGTFCDEALTPRIAGSLRTGDLLLVGPAWGKVRSMLNSTGDKISIAGPSEPVQVWRSPGTMPCINVHISRL
jgi:translation initiation factor IF-2